MVKESSTGSTTSNKIRLNLTIQVERVQFDPDTCVLRLSGRNREETEHVKASPSYCVMVRFMIDALCWK